MCLQMSTDRQQEWLRPTAVFFTTFYLCLEALATHEVSWPVATSIVAITCLDALSKPWDLCNVSVSITADTDQKDDGAAQQKRWRL